MPDAPRPAPSSQPSAACDMPRSRATRVLDETRAGPGRRSRTSSPGRRRRRSRPGRDRRPRPSIWLAGRAMSARPRHVVGHGKGQNVDRYPTCHTIGACLAAARRTPFAGCEVVPGHDRRPGPLRARLRDAPRTRGARRLGLPGGALRGAASVAAGGAAVPTLEPSTRGLHSSNGRSTTPASVSAPTAARGRSGGTCAPPIASSRRGRPPRRRALLRHARRGAGARVRRPGRHRRERRRRAAASSSSRRAAAGSAGASSTRPTRPAARRTRRDREQLPAPNPVDDPPGARYFAGEMLCGVARPGAMPAPLRLAGPPTRLALRGGRPRVSAPFDWPQGC